MTLTDYSPRKEGGIGLYCIQYCVDASVVGLEVYIKKSKERSIIAANYRSDYTSTDRKKNWK